MREGISDVATRLFAERGFDHVTIDEIAAAAQVGRKTVFNHFPRKEDLFFDRVEEIRERLRDVVQRRDAGVAPLEAYRLFAHRLMREASPYVDFSDASLAFADTIRGSEALKARARSLRDELAGCVARALAQSAAPSMAQSAPDPDACLAGAMLLAVWTSARGQAHRAFLARRDPREAGALFLALVDRGTHGVRAAMRGTPYA